MSAYFLFDGGNYKVRQDDGRERIPLTKQEAFAVYYDHEVPGDTDNSIGSYLAAGKYPEIFTNLAVGDELFIALGPDEALYRGLWMKSFDPVDGFTVDLDMVSVLDVCADIEAGGDGTGVARVPDTDVLAYDFTNGMGDAIKDACDKAALYGGTWRDYFNEDAYVSLAFADMYAANQGDSIYLRITVTALGTLGEVDDACCNVCTGSKLPMFQVGAFYDRSCADKMPVQKFCNCDEDLYTAGSPAIGQTSSAGNASAGDAPAGDDPTDPGGDDPVDPDDL